MKKETGRKIDPSLSIEEVYASRPRYWLIYTLIILAVCSLLGWSGSTVRFTGFASKGVTIAQGIGNGLLHPDTNLLFNLTEEGVPYQLLQTMAIAVLGTLIGGLLAVPVSFLACEKIVPKPVAFIFHLFILLIRTISQRITIP